MSPLLIAGICVSCGGAGSEQGGPGGGTAETTGDGDGDQCGENLHVDDTSCGNGQVEAGELCMGTEQQLNSPDPWGAFLEVGDFDGDGDLDVLGDAYVWLNEGGRQFGGPVQWGPTIKQDPWSPGGTVVGEFDGDPGDDVLFVASDDMQGLGIAPGGPDFPQPGWRRELEDSPSAVSAGDFDLDGLDDVLLLVFPANGPQADVLYGFNDGTQSFALDPIPGGPYSSGAVADVDADGDADMVLSRSGGNTVFMLSQANGEFEQVDADPTDLGVRNALYGFDLDCDGLPDVAQTRFEFIELYAGSGAGVYQARLSFDSMGAAAPVLAGVAHLNADAALDLLITNGAEAMVYLGDSNFGLDGPYRLPGELWSKARAPDLDGDGSADYVLMRNDWVSVVYSDP